MTCIDNCLHILAASNKKKAPAMICFRKKTCQNNQCKGLKQVLEVSSYVP